MFGMWSAACDIVQYKDMSLNKNQDSGLSSVAILPQYSQHVLHFFDKIQPFKPSLCGKDHFISLQADLIFLQLGVFNRINFFIKLVYQYMTIFFNFQTTSNHVHPLLVGKCDSYSRLVVDEDGYGKFRLENVSLNNTCDLFVRNLKRHNQAKIIKNQYFYFILAS